MHVPKAPTRASRNATLTAPLELFELKVLVEAHDWRDVAALMASVDRALDPHHSTTPGDRRWSVVANRLPADRAHELLEFIAAADHTGQPEGLIGKEPSR